MSSEPNIKIPNDFSLVQGGPLFQLFVRCRLSTTALGWLERRIVFVIMVTWLPLLILSILSKQAISDVQVPLIYDIEVHVRFLISLPLLLIAEWVVHKRITAVVAQFVEREIVVADVRARFDACVEFALNWRNSLAAEIFLIVLVMTLGHLVFFETSTLNSSVWYGHGTAPEWQWSPAGYWMTYISIPVYQFFVLRWLFRIVVWGRFLWQVSRLDLRLIPTHPDHAAGLGFLSGSSAAFIPLLLSQGAILSAMLADRIWNTGAVLIEFKMEIAFFVVFFLLLVLGPLCVFAPALLRAKREGLLAYGKLASRYVREFENKWLKGEANPDEAFIGSGDIQSLADLNNSFEVIRDMRSFPFDRHAVIQTIVAMLAPLLPLLLTMISLEDLLKRLIGMLL